ncbi:MAG: PQQ-binding-like beta-propeller repeat protein [Candidatus Bathyarchaeia archaeon]|jgi:hypothetical protein
MNNFKNRGKNKTLAIAIALLLTLSIATPIFSLQTVSAHTPPWQIKTYAFIDANPDPIGIGQTAFITFGIDKVPNTVSGAYGDRWTTLTVTVTDPTGKVTTLSGFTADDTGFSHTTFVPDKLGNYTFVCNFPGQTLTGANPPPTGNGPVAQYIGDVYLPSTSNTATMTVTNEPASMVPFNPLPTTYWQRPINMMNSNWNTISGNWLGDFTYVNAGLGYNATTDFDPYIQLPNSAHVLWTTPLAPGGLIGGEFGATAHSNFYSTAQYECKYLAVIIDGVLYYTFTPDASTDKQGLIAQNLKTGAILWHRYDINGTLARGQIFNYISPNQYGGHAYLWTTTMSMYDAVTGNWILDVANSTTSGLFVSQQTPDDIADGTLLEYYINTTVASSPTLCMWNSTRCINTGPTGTGDPNTWMYRPTTGNKIDFKYGIQWSAPIATNISGNPISLSLSGAQSSGSIGISGNTVVMSYATTGNWEEWQVDAGYSLTDGHQEWLVNRTVTDWTRVVTYTTGEGHYIEMNNEDQTITVFNADTGAQVCVCKFPTNTIWGYFSAYRPVGGYGMIYDATFDGHCYAWNATTGALVWNWWAGPAGYNTVYNSWPFKTVELVADGKVYLNGGHTYNPPLFRGSHAYALDAFNGSVVWSVNSFCESNSPVVAAADGVITLPNAYDNLLYAYGTGRSATTVDAPSAAITLGSSLVIRGTVTDQSPGQTCLGIPAAGTPAISDASMGDWMNYLYGQQPIPTNATGVPVSLDVIDANNNFRHIGDVTSDITGTFSFQYTPDIPGKYTVIASFPGSESYYASSAESSFAVDLGPTQAPTATAVTGLATSSDVMYIGVAIIVIIIIIGVVLAVLMMRKRP